MVILLFDLQHSVHVIQLIPHIVPLLDQEPPVLPSLEVLHILDQKRSSPRQLRLQIQPSFLEAHPLHIPPIIIRRQLIQHKLCQVIRHHCELFPLHQRFQLLEMQKILLILVIRNQNGELSIILVVDRDLFHCTLHRALPDNQLMIVYIHGVFENIIYIIMNQILSNKDEPIFIQKTVRLENEALPSRFDTVKGVFEYRQNSRVISLNYALQTLLNQGYSIDASQIFLWDPVKRMFVYVGIFPSQVEMVVQLEHFQENVIQIRYRKIQRPVHVEVERSDVSKRVKERSIQEAIESVKRWMEFYELTDKNGKRLFTLLTASQEIGIAKKTLDDYKSQIRLGEEYGFDFNKNRLMKIGTLRNFNKEMSALRKYQSRPPSPEAMPLRQIQAEANRQMEVEEEKSEHSCYGGSDRSSSRE